MTARGLELLVGGLVVFRVLMVWVYERTGGSLLVAMLMHASLTYCTFFVLVSQASGLPLLAFWYVSDAVMWLVVAAGALIIRGQPARQRLRRQAA